MDYNEFAERIKAKYPEYNDMDNRTLAEKMVAKFPNEYSDVTFDDVNLEEAPQQATQGFDIMNSPYQAGEFVGDALAAPIVAMKENIPIKEAFQKNRDITAPKLAGEDFVRDMAVYSSLPMLKGGGVANAIGNAVIQGGIPGAIEGLKNNNALGGAGLGTSIGLGLQGLPYVGKVAGKIPVVQPVVNVGKRIGKAAVNGLLESFAMGQNAVKRMLESHRGTDISKNAQYFGSEAFMNDIANRFKTGVDSLRNQEVKAFREAKDNLLQNNSDTTVNLEDFVQDTYRKLYNNGLIDANGVITPTGKRANGLEQLLEDLNYYNGNFDLNELQRLKANVLDDVINYKPGIGQTLNNSTRALQGIAKNARKNINDILNETLGEKYTAINNKLSAVLNSLDNVPELKDLTNSTNLDTLSNKLKKVGTTRPQAQIELDNLENVMNNNEISISENGLVNDILDYNAAKDIAQRIRTGQDANFRNIPRRALVQPLTEFYIDRVMPFQKGVKQVVTPFAERLLTPMVVRGASPLLYGGVSND